ncbi:MAG: hypothetical protein H7833_18960 [Magnetococcus sp. DMHC-1]|nr:DUF3782 domain-containing protein [Magnetococcales bacterium]
MDYQAVYDKIWTTLDRITERQDRITERQDRMEENYAKWQADLQAEHALTQQKFRELAEKIAESSARLDAQIDRVDKQLGELGNRLGEYVESMVAPACETLFAERGIPVHEVSPNRLARRFGDSLELDLTVINDHLLVVVETKSKLSEKHVKKFLKKLPRVPIFFPTYAGMHIMGAVASMVVPDQVARMAMKAGLFVIAPAGDSVRLLNPIDFKPHLWNRVGK